MRCQAQKSHDVRIAVNQGKIGRPLLDFAANRIGAGQEQLAHCLKQEISASGHPAAALQDYSDDRPFLNPSLFAFFREPDPDATRGVTRRKTARRTKSSGVISVTRVIRSALSDSPN